MKHIKIALAMLFSSVIAVLGAMLLFWSIATLAWAYEHHPHILACILVVFVFGAMWYAEQQSEMREVEALRAADSPDRDHGDEA